MANIVVTGGAGFIGTNFALMAANEGHSVKVIDNFSRYTLLSGNAVSHDQNLEVLKRVPGIEIVRKDLRNIGEVEGEFRDADWILHAAGQTGVVNSVLKPRDDFENNLLATFNVLEAARLARSDPTLVFCSTNKVFGTNPNSMGIREGETRYEFSPEFSGFDETFSTDNCAHTPYGCSKLAADIYAQDYYHQYGLRTGVFRMSCIYGKYQLEHEYQGWLAHVVRNCLDTGRVTIFGNGKQVRDVLHVRDLIRAYRSYFSRAKSLGHQVFCIGGGPDNAISLLELISIIEKTTGKKIEIEFRDWRPRDQKIFITDNTKVCRALNWEPTISSEEGIGELVEEMSGHEITG
ncbi:MAG: NAD-dependent epimerase/dehydratase family protein [Promethearchaeota archaeon]